MLFVAVAFGVLGCHHAEPAPRDPSSARASAPESAPPRAGAPSEATAEDLAVMLAAQVRITSVMAQALRVGTAVWQTANPGCPQASDVVAAHMVPDAVRAEDAWGTPYRIVCSRNSPTVISAGPDRAFDTGDDIRASER